MTLPAQRDKATGLIPRTRKVGGKRDSLTSPAQALAGFRRDFWMVFLFSIFANVLILTGPLYMLQIYDRVLPARSQETLVALTLLVAVLFAFLGFFDHVRGRVLSRIGSVLQQRLDPRTFRAVLWNGGSGRRKSPAGSELKDVESLLQFCNSRLALTIWDVPWTPAFIAVIYLFHPWLGHLALGGGAVLVAIATFGRFAVRNPERAAHEASLQGDAFADSVRHQREMVRALGMRRATLDRWQHFRTDALEARLASGDRVSLSTSATKAFRFFLQAAVLGLGAYLVLSGEMTAGAMIAAAILLGRALAPVEQMIGGWPLAQRTRQAWHNLSGLLAERPEPEELMLLPRPTGRLMASNVTVVPPGHAKPSLWRVSFALEPGQVLGVIGPSGSGKSTLARAITGIWQPRPPGEVRLDGALLGQYDPDVLGTYLGYVPQEVALLPGTVAENIARMEVPDTDAVVSAAQKAGAHDMILNELPHGYNTPVGEDGHGLSGGQKQRIGLARAFYGDPVLLVLDEPDSSLDNFGQEALKMAVRQAKAAEKTVIIMAHRPPILAECDLVLVLTQGAISSYGPRDEVLDGDSRSTRVPLRAVKDGQ